MNTKVNKLEMTLKLLTMLKIVSVLKNNDVVIGSLTDNMTALSLSKLISIHIITEKNYHQHLHVNSFIDTKATQVVAAWFGCKISLNHIEKMSFQDTAKYLLVKPLNDKLVTDYCYIIYDCGKCYKMLNAKFLCKLCINPS